MIDASCMVEMPGSIVAAAVRLSRQWEKSGIPAFAELRREDGQQTWKPFKFLTIDDCERLVGFNIAQAHRAIVRFERTKSGKTASLAALRIMLARLYRSRSLDLAGEPHDDESRMPFPFAAGN